MATAGFDSPDSIRGQLQAALHQSRQRRRTWRLGALSSVDWSLVAVSGGFRITITNYQGAPSGFQYSLDGGAWTAVFGSAASMPLTHTVTTGAGSKSVRLRTIQGTSPGTETTAKSVTVA